MNEEKEHHKNLEHGIVNMISKDLVNKMEELFIEGLKRKGFEFENKIELANFIVNRCRQECSYDNKKITYYVDDIPFFFWNHEIKLKTINEVNEIKFSSSYGSYAYL